MMILKLRVVGMQKPLKEDAILKNESIEFGVTKCNPSGDASILV